MRRLAGADRYATSVAVSAATFPDGADAVFIATGLAFPDALAAVPAAAAAGGPLLLVPPDELPAVVADEIRRLAPARAVVLGGTGAGSAAVEDELAELL